MILYIQKRVNGQNSLLIIVRSAFDCRGSQTEIFFTNSLKQWVHGYQAEQVEQLDTAAILDEE